MHALVALSICFQCCGQSFKKKIISSIQVSEDEEWMRVYKHQFKSEIQMNMSYIPLWSEKNLVFNSVTWQCPSSVLGGTDVPVCICLRKSNSERQEASQSFHMPRPGAAILSTVFSLLKGVDDTSAVRVSPSPTYSYLCLGTLDCFFLTSNYISICSNINGVYLA